MLVPVQTPGIGQRRKKASECIYISFSRNHDTPKRFFTNTPGLFHDTTLAGTPATVAFSGTSFTTTAPAAIVALFPICTSSTIETCGPMYTLSPIVAGVRLLVPIDKNWLIFTLLPIFVPPFIITPTPWPI